jgi:hypothetical protein
LSLSEFFIVVTIHIHTEILKSNTKGQEPVTESDHFREDRSLDHAIFNKINIVGMPAMKETQALAGIIRAPMRAKKALTVMTIRGSLTTPSHGLTAKTPKVSQIIIKRFQYLLPHCLVSREIRISSATVGGNDSNATVRKEVFRNSSVAFNAFTPNHNAAIAVGHKRN